MQDVEPAGAPAVLEHLPRRQRRVAIHRLQMMREVAIGVMLQLAAQLPDRARRRAPIRARSGRSTRAAAIVQAQLVVGIPVGRSDPAAEVKA